MWLTRTFTFAAGEKLAYHYTTEENSLVLRRYWTIVRQSCAIKPICTTGKERRITRWEHEHILEAVQRRLEEHPEKMRQRGETVDIPSAPSRSDGEVDSDLHFGRVRLLPPTLEATMQTVASDPKHRLLSLLILARFLSRWNLVDRHG